MSLLNELKPYLKCFQGCYCCVGTGTKPTLEMFQLVLLEYNDDESYETTFVYFINKQDWCLMKALPNNDFLSLLFKKEDNFVIDEINNLVSCTFWMKDNEIYLDGSFGGFKKTIIMGSNGPIYNINKFYATPKFCLDNTTKQLTALSINDGLNPLYCFNTCDCYTSIDENKFNDKYYIIVHQYPSDGEPCCIAKSRVYFKNKFDWCLFENIHYKNLFKQLNNKNMGCVFGVARFEDMNDIHLLENVSQFIEKDPLYFDQRFIIELNKECEPFELD